MKYELKIAILALGTRGDVQPLVAKASELGEKLRTENGVNKAVRIIDSYLKGGNFESSITR